MPTSDLFRLIIRSSTIFLIIIFVGYFITGKIPRAHNVVPKDSSLMLAGKNLSPEELAKEYQPNLYASNETLKPKSMFYEVVDTLDRYSIIYHIVWESQKNPNLLFNYISKIANLAYFGFNFNDTEFVQADIDKATGEITKVLMPTVFMEKANTNERLTLAIKKGEENYQAIILDDDGNKLSQKDIVAPVAPGFSIEVINWNHLMVMASGAGGKSKLNFPLKYLDEETYKSEKFARREHAEFHTTKSPANTPIILFVASIFLFYFTVVQWSYLKKNRARKEGKA